MAAPSATRKNTSVNGGNSRNAAAVEKEWAAPEDREHDEK
jgi:hypothetical protein